MSLTDLAALIDPREPGLDDDRRRRLEALVASDPEAAAGLAWVQRLADTAGRVPLAPRSGLLDQRLRQHFSRWTRAQAVLSAPVTRIRAELVFDSRTDRLVGVRGETEAVNLVYACALGELVVDLVPSRDRHLQLLGQVLLEEPTAAPVFEAVLSGDGGRCTAESDAYGRFRLDGVAPGRSVLRVGNGEVEISAELEPARLLSDDAGT